MSPPSHGINHFVADGISLVKWTENTSLDRMLGPGGVGLWNISNGRVGYGPPPNVSIIGNVKALNFRGQAVEGGVSQKYS